MPTCRRCHLPIESERVNQGLMTCGRHNITLTMLCLESTKPKEQGRLLRTYLRQNSTVTRTELAEKLNISVETLTKDMQCS